MSEEIDLEDNPTLKRKLQAALDEAEIDAEAVALFPDNMLVVLLPDGCNEEWAVEYDETDEQFHISGLDDL